MSFFTSHIVKVKQDIIAFREELKASFTSHIVKVKRFKTAL